MKAKSRPVVAIFQSFMMMPLGTYTTARRRGGFGEPAKAGNIASSAGSAIAVPMPRKSVRRSASGEGLRPFGLSGPVVAFQPPAERVRQQLLYQAADEGAAILNEERLELGGRLKGASVGQNAGCVDRSVAILCAPGADGIEIFQAEPQRVHAGVA